MADMKIAEKIAENVEPLKKRDKLVKRNANGQFERGSKALAGAGRPRGSLNKTTTQLREAILGALEAAGGPEGSVGYLRRLAIENSSAFASLLGKVLPTTLAASESDRGLGVKMIFERHIVWPDGRKEIEGVTPKALPAPGASHVLPSDASSTQHARDMEYKDEHNQ
jgi:hypothetical protein